MVTARTKLGDFGERLAEHRLESAGLAIVARKVRVASGEIDLVAREGDDIVCVEVRTRRAAPGIASESITPAKLARMWRCAFDYCEANGLDSHRLRIDLVTVELDASGLLSNFLHLRGLDAPVE